MPIRYLAQHLKFWYNQLKKRDNGLYSPSSLIWMRASIQRYLSPSEVRRKINIVTDEDFKEANNMLKLASTLKQTDLQVPVVHLYQWCIICINDEDLEKLEHYFNRSDAARLQEEVFFNILYPFGYRGRKWIRDIKVSSIQIHQDQNNVEFVENFHVTTYFLSQWRPLKFVVLFKSSTRETYYAQFHEEIFDKRSIIPNLYQSQRSRNSCDTVSQQRISRGTQPRSDGT